MRPELTSAILTFIGIGGAWLATLLGRRGKKEDTRIAERTQAFDEVLQLADRRLAEIDRLIAERDAANADKEALRESWEKRWDRQMARCRSITDPLVQALNQLQTHAPHARAEAGQALRDLAEHNERDHTLDLDDEQSA